MPKSKKNGSTKVSPLKQEYRKARKRALNLINRLQKRGYDFPDDIIPAIPKKITRASINTLNKITPEKAYSKALSYQTPEGSRLTVKEGREFEALRRKNQRIKNLRKNKTQNLEGEELERGVELYNEIEKIKAESGYQKAFERIKNFTPKEYELYERTREIIEKPDKGDFKPEPEPIKDKGLDDIDDEELEEWKRHYEEQIKKPKEEREYIYDDENILTGIKYRLEEFFAEYNANSSFASRREYNFSLAKSLVSLLDIQIQIEGRDEIVKRMSKRGIEIDDAIETLLYDSDQSGNVSVAFNKLAEIILGRGLTFEESHYYQSQAEWAGSSPEDYDTDGEFME